MTTDEEYLDNLLKSLTENEQQIKTMEETLNEMTRSAENGESFVSSSKEADEIQDSNGENDDKGDLVFDSDISNDEQTSSAEETLEESSSNDDIFADFFAEALSGEGENSFDNFDSQFAENKTGSEQDLSSGEPEEWQSGIDDLLNKADEQVNIDAADVNNMDVTDLIDQMKDADEDLAEINGLLKNEDSNTNNDGIAMPEGVNENAADGNSSDTSSDNASDESADAAQNGEDEADNKSTKKRLKREKKEKKKKTPKKKDNDENPDLGILDEKPSFLMKFLDFLTREEDDGSENDEILDKINKENEKKQKKEEKKRKKAEKKKGKADADEGEDAAADTDKKKKKKEKKKKEKKEKDPNEEVKEKPVKILSRKNLLVLIAACATLLGCIFALSTFLTEYSDRQNARQAFYDGDYEEVYRLFYDKNLGSSDSAIYNKVKIVLTIERKLESYENNLALNRELEAVDALMQGVGCYQKLQGIDEYDVRNEVDAIYRQICSILEESYGITVEKALEINTYDNDTYTRVLDSIVNGTEFVMPGEEVEEVEEEIPPQDILPEEEDIISY